MSIRKLWRLIIMQIAGWSISIGAVLAASLFLALMSMTWVITATTVFEIQIRYKPVAALVGILALAAVTAMTVLGKRRKTP